MVSRDSTPLPPIPPLPAAKEGLAPPGGTGVARGVATPRRCETHRRPIGSNWGPIGVQLGSNRGTKIVSFSAVLILKTHQNHPQRGPGGAPGGPGGGPGGAPGAPVLVPELLMLVFLSFHWLSLVFHCFSLVFRVCVPLDCFS